MDKINIWILLSVSLAITLAYSVMRNFFSKNTVKTVSDFYIFNFFSSVFSGIVLLFISGGLSVPSLFTVFLGVGFGIVTALAAILNLQAFRIGPMSYTTVILTTSMIIPAISGRIFWDESVGFFQYLGVVFMLLSIALSVNRSKKGSPSGTDTDGAVKESGRNKTSLKWLALCLVGFVFCGMIGVMQKLHQSSRHAGELAEFLVIAFFTAAAFSLAVYYWYKTVQKAPKSVSFSPRLGTFWVAVMSGFFIALANQINLYLSGAMNSMVFFPIVNGGGLVLATISAVLFFRERLTTKQWIGVSAGTVSVLLLCGVI